MNEVLLYSGGMDSFIAWHYLKKPPTIYVGLGHRYEDEEWDSVIETLPETEVISLDLGEYEKDDAEIPLRNLYLAMIAVNKGYDRIWIIFQKDEKSIQDRTKAFFDKASELLSMLSEREIIIDSPFWNMDKTDMVKWYVNEGLDIDELRKTWACYTPKVTMREGEPCGNCGACFRRYVALRNCDIDAGYELKEEIRNHYRDKLSSYTKERQDRMKRWL